MSQGEFPEPLPAEQVLMLRFEKHREHLRAVAQRILGSATEADDAVQETWLRLHRTDTSTVEDLGAWLTTVVGRVCLTMLRDRGRLREEPLPSYQPASLSAVDDADPEAEAMLADSIGVALVEVLETLAPAERLAFVLHDLFEVPFDDIAPVVGRTPTATRQLASRARRRIRGAPSAPAAADRAVVDAFLAAARGGDLETLVRLLDPDVVVHTYGALRPAGVVEGARAVAEGAATCARLAEVTRPALLNGALGAVALTQHVPTSAVLFTVAADRVTALDILTDPALLDGVAITYLDEA
ncbi:sigma-70 family RNA polymerase sigma factor [Kribbella sp. NPDC050124]|uniref:sigma-70 family RNA polymerase sigma factor n=1 Tax=Kribbella sp. NPDC050124 TaxID=3364114 RepID=UPI0037891086